MSTYSYRNETVDKDNLAVDRRITLRELIEALQQYERTAGDAPVYIQGGGFADIVKVSCGNGPHGEWKAIYLDRTTNWTPRQTEEAV